MIRKLVEEVSHWAREGIVGVQKEECHHWHWAEKRGPAPEILEVKVEVVMAVEQEMVQN